MTDIDRIRQRSVAAVILAAGAGSRYAGDTHKLFVEIDGRPVISHVVDAARASEVDEVIVVGGAVVFNTSCYWRTASRTLGFGVLGVAFDRNRAFALPGGQHDDL